MSQSGVLYGSSAFDALGSSVASYDCGGNRSVLIGAYNASADGLQTNGAVYLVATSRQRFNKSNVESMTVVRFSGVAPDEDTGAAVVGMRDFNGDGLPDFAIGSPNRGEPRNTLGIGGTQLLWGRAFWPQGAFTLIELNYSYGVVFNGTIPTDFLSGKGSGYADLNGDNLSDLLITASYSYRTLALQGLGTGKIDVVFGTRSSVPSLIQLNGMNGFYSIGVANADRLGSAISGVYDINNDGYEDVVVGASQYVPASLTKPGLVYGIYGRTGPFPNPFDLSNPDGISFFVINGTLPRGGFGSAISAARDMDSDSAPDFAVGAPYANSSLGVGYICWGAKSNLPNPYPLSSCTAIEGRAAGDAFSYALADLGDFCNVGRNATAFSAPFAYNGAGAVWVFLGSPGLRSTPLLRVADCAPPDCFEFRGEFPGDQFGLSVSSAGDFDGDHIPDMIVGAPSASPNGLTQAGAAYVYYGGECPTTPLPAPAFGPAPAPHPEFFPQPFPEPAPSPAPLPVSVPLPVPLLQISPKLPSPLPQPSSNVTLSPWPVLTPFASLTPVSAAPGMTWPTPELGLKQNVTALPIPAGALPSLPPQVAPQPIPAPQGPRLPIYKNPNIRPGPNPFPPYFSCPCISKIDASIDRWLSWPLCDCNLPPVGIVYNCSDVHYNVFCIIKADVNGSVTAFIAPGPLVGAVMYTPWE